MTKPKLLKDVLDERLGLSEFVEPMVHKVVVLFTPNRVEEYDFEDIFTRIPPFEPIVIRESTYGSVKLKGDYVWFITNLKNASKRLKKLGRMFTDLSNKFNVKCDIIVCGDYEDLLDGIVLKRLIVPRVVGDGKEKWMKLIEIPLKAGSGNIEIQYGFSQDTVGKWASQCGDESLKSDDPEFVLNHECVKGIFSERSKVKGYSPTTLNYVSTCYSGFFISTDPFKVREKCDKCMDDSRKRTLLCRDYEGHGRYEYRRRIFPRVYAELRNTVLPYEIEKLDKFYRLPYICVVSENARCIKKVDALSISFETLGKVRLELEKPIITPYFNTNALMLLIDNDYVKVFIDVLKKSLTVTCSVYLCTCSVDSCNEVSVKVPLINLLVSKFIWRNVSLWEKDYNIELDLENDMLKVKLVTGKREYDLLVANEVKRLVEDITSSNDFIRFVNELLAHTLAHAILLSTSSIEPHIEHYGAYTYDVYRGYTTAGVIENTKNGSLRLFPTLSQQFKDFMLDGDSDKKVSIFKPQVIINMFGNLPKTWEKLDRIVVESVRESCKPETRDRILNAVTETVSDRIEGMEVGEDLKKAGMNERTLVSHMVKAIIELLNNLVVNLIQNQVYIDRYSFTSVILWKLLREANIKNKVINHVISRVSSETSDKDVKEVLEKLGNLVFDLLIETEMVNLVTDILTPDYCSDGCEQDLYLPRCTATLIQPFLISRCLLGAFLKFSGLNVGIPRLDLKVFECSGAELETLTKLAREHLYILTSAMSEESVNLLRNILEGSNAKVTIEVDKRIEEKPIILEQLDMLKVEFSDRFTYSLTREPHHGKMIIADFLKVHTSWNFGTGTRVLQTYSSELAS
ncbi:MAG: hypothetical protein ACO2OZ_02530 [Acidilobaceae archaeon]|jgi:hypothetical protein